MDVALFSTPRMPKEARTLFDAMTVLPTGAHRLAYSKFIRILVGAGIWTELDLLYILAAETAQQALLNLKNPATFPLVVNGTGGVFTAGQGYIGNVAGAYYLDTTYNPTIQINNYLQDDACAGVYVRGPNVQGANPVFGNHVSQMHIAVRNASDLASWRVNRQTSSGTVASTNAIGFWHTQRASSVSQQMFKDGVQVGSINTASAAMNSTFFTLFKYGVSTYDELRQVSEAHIGGALTAEQIGVFNAALSGLLQALAV